MYLAGLHQNCLVLFRMIFVKYVLYIKTRNINFKMSIHGISRSYTTMPNNVLQCKFRVVIIYIFFFKNEMLPLCSLMM